MPEVTLRIGIVGQWRLIDHPWQDHFWSASDILPDAPSVPSGTVLQPGQTTRLVYLGGVDLVLATSETARYRENLMSQTPMVWVVAQPDMEFPRLVAATADPAEGEAHTEAADNLVWTLPMPADLAGALAQFVETHHVERVFIKRKRKRFEDSRGEA